MSRKKTKEELKEHEQHALMQFESYLDKLIDSNDERLNSKSDKLCYWLEDWLTFLDFETSFSPMSLRRYKHGEIIKVHLGFNVGSEEGGLHYAVVADKNNAKSSPVITIVPLTSVKPHTNLSKLKKGSVFLGNELFTNLNSKISHMQKHLLEEVAGLEYMADSLVADTPDNVRQEIKSRVAKARNEVFLLERIRKEVQRMKTGSIALVNQITTISKIRIYDPKTDYDILSNIKLSNEKLDLIDAEICKHYTNFSNI